LVTSKVEALPTPLWPPIAGGSAIKIYVIRVLEIDYVDGAYYYHQVETGEEYGPFPNLPSMIGHLHERLLEQIVEEIAHRQH
jgi:hypothetical protein